jgi:hypothetical protein
MNQVRLSAGIRDIDGDRSTLTQPQDWPRDLATIRRGPDRYSGPNLQRAWLDTNTVISLAGSKGSTLPDIDR